MPERKPQLPPANRSVYLSRAQVLWKLELPCAVTRLGPGNEVKPGNEVNEVMGTIRASTKKSGILASFSDL
jgi:hypothetical protein